jgi:two-component system response regulator DevR
MGADMNKVTRVFLVDDHPLIVEGMRSLLGYDDGLTVVGAARTLAEAYAELELAQPDVVLVDERLPDGSGIELIGLFADSVPWRFLMVSGNDNIDCVRRALDAGACGYVLKDIEGQRLCEAVHSVARGGFPLDPRLTGVLLDGIRQRRDERTGLTWRERELLSLLADGLTNAQISERMRIAPRTAKSYVGALLNRLGVDTRAAAVGFAARQGLLSLSNSDPRDISTASNRPEVMAFRH